MTHQRIPALGRARARAMRREMTQAEYRLWTVLRDRELHHWRFRRQAPIGQYIADFFCPRLKLIVEVDGDQHGFDGNAQQDAARTHWLQRAGYRVLRFGNRDVMHNLDGVWQFIAIACEKQAAVLGIRSTTE
jgi:very-short-patch-repair endonuclease